MDYLGTLNCQQNRSRATHVAIIKYDAGGFDPKVFVNCRVQGGLHHILIIATCVARERLLFIENVA